MSWAIALALVSTAALASAPGDERAIAELLAALNRERAGQGLAPLRADAALAAAAQAHADDMAARGYFEVESPDGTTIDQRVRAAGYAADVLAAKLVRSEPLATPASLAAGWGARPEESRTSVFHPEVDEVGVGLASGAGGFLWTIVLARRHDPAGLLAARAEALGDLAAVRAAYLAAVNDARRAGGLPALRADAALDRAAQAHAEALLAARGAGRDEHAVAPLGERVQMERRGAGPGGVAGGSVIWGRRNAGSRTESNLRDVGESVVVDAADVATAVATALTAADPSDLRDARFSRLGVGLAFERDGESWRAVWVACLTRL
jgi:uncharacterized protein YkwD